MTRDDRPKAPAPWYADGLRFECRPDCGACCTDHGEYAYVYLVGEDLPALAAHLGLSDEAFAQEYTDCEDGHVFLKMTGPDCMFLQGQRCGVYEARPRQCRTFPFWPENLRSRRRWRQLCEFCPGIDEGPVHPLRVIQSHLKEHE